MDFRMKDFGAVLESRDLARRLCEAVKDEHSKRPDEKVKLDFAGVRVVSNFFADELVGGLVSAMGADGFEAAVTLANLSDMNRIWVQKAVERHKDDRKRAPDSKKKAKK
jgi:hypothetical protein